jgi:hypothetical protein
MAHVVIAGEKVRLELSLLEILGAFHGSPEVNLSEVESIEIEENPWVREVLKGVRAPGTGIPFVVMLGTMRYLQGKDFVAIYRRKPAAIITLKSGKFKRWIFEIKDMSEIDALKRAINVA